MITDLSGNPYQIFDIEVYLESMRSFLSIAYGVWKAWNLVATVPYHGNSTFTNENGACLW